jgi:hypothetical protein
VRTNVSAAVQAPEIETELALTISQQENAASSTMAAPPLTLRHANALVMAESMWAD